MKRHLLLAVGGGSTLLGVGLLAAPALGRVGGGESILIGVVVGVLAIGGWFATDRLSTARKRPTPTRVDSGTDARVPGDAFDQELATIPGYSERGADRRAAVRERLRDVAVDHLVRETGCSVEQAHARLEDGTWTSDPTAAALFTDTPPSARAKVRTLFGGRSAFQRRVEHAVAALDSEVPRDE